MSETLNSLVEVPPQPIPNEDTLGFWEAMENGRVDVCRCQDCRLWLQPPLERCPQCWGETSFERITGDGIIHAFIVVYQPAIPGYRDQLPYAVGLVELVEQPGLRLPARIVGIDPTEVRVGQRVTAQIDDLPGGPYKVAVFRPA
ncbi:MAG: hypothetical protein JWL70_654 [Acidimicrobiia bacterium]|nr:hypothetical protein [Acidimicrobiia bacterium]